MIVGIILGMFIIASVFVLMFFNGCYNESDKQEEDKDQIEWIREHNRRKRDNEIWIEKQH